MVDLTANPYYLSEEDCQWVESTIAGMSDEEKVGQLFFQLTQSMDEAYLKELIRSSLYKIVPTFYCKIDISSGHFILKSL